MSIREVEKERQIGKGLCNGDIEAQHWFIGLLSKKKSYQGWVDF